MPDSDPKLAASQRPRDHHESVRGDGQIGASAQVVANPNSGRAHNIVDLKPPLIACLIGRKLATLQADSPLRSLRRPIEVDL
ncbi:MAG: hypothetical protein EXR77_05425 [Myxococcales bacterium]|nr:hypothetical protein [Myxococcales bacterium]